MGIRVTASRLAQKELWEVVVPQLPEGMFDIAAAEKHAMTESSMLAGAGRAHPMTCRSRRAIAGAGDGSWDGMGVGRTAYIARRGAAAPVPSVIAGHRAPGPPSGTYARPLLHA